jgi:hypothetical protein
MSAVSQQDLNVRLQLTGCAYSKLANEFANNLKYGRKCAIDNEKTLLLLNAYIELMECYQLELVSTYSNTTASFNFLDYYEIGLLTTEFYFNDVLVGEPYEIDSELDLENAAAELNLLQSDYVITLEVDISKPSSKPSILVFTGSCSTTTSISIVFNYDGGRSQILNLPLSLGNCSSRTKKYNNCISEKQLLSIFDKISKITGVCFKPLGFTYTPVLGK